MLLDEKMAFQGRGCGFAGCHNFDRDGDFEEREGQVLTKYEKNDELPVIKAGWRGNPVDQKDRFMNDEHPFVPKMTDVLKWKAGGNKFKQEKRRTIRSGSR